MRTYIEDKYPLIHKRIKDVRRRRDGWPDMRYEEGRKVKWIFDKAYEVARSKDHQHIDRRIKDGTLMWVTI